MKIQSIRHATLLLNIGNKRILVDPMLSAKGEMPAVANALNTNNNPLVDLPMDSSKLTEVDAILLTHIHRDHFDEAAVNLLSKDIPVFCQPDDKEKIEEKGFKSVRPIYEDHTWNSITFNRTGGQHGRGEVLKAMGTVSGYVITADNEASLYITGDSVWCSEVESALEAYKPKVIISYAGCAKIREVPITMGKEDILNLSKKAPEAKIIVVHMEAWNHCVLSRDELKTFLDRRSLSHRVYVPNDGEELSELW